jgi:toxin ParE1/3/4
MSNYHLTNEAVQDLSDIWNYTCDTWSEEQADKYYDMLLKTCSDLAHNPNYGRNYAKITKDLLGFLASRHIIFYRVVSSSEIEITRILHESMDLKTRLAGQKST